MQGHQKSRDERHDKPGYSSILLLHGSRIGWGSALFLFIPLVYTRYLLAIKQIQIGKAGDKVLLSDDYQVRKRRSDNSIYAVQFYFVSLSPLCFI